jgi:malate dehydrogenase
MQGHLTGFVLSFLIVCLSSVCGFLNSNSGLKFARKTKQFVFHPSASWSDTKGQKVTVVGASGGIGQPLSLLLKLNPCVSELSLFDVVRTPGVAADLSHINSRAKVKGFCGYEQIEHALYGSEVVLISAGVPRQPGMTRDDLFNTNANIIKKLGEACIKACPNAIYLIITNPVNSVVPIFAEVLKKAGSFDAQKVIGVTTLDVVRANTFVAENQNLEVKDVKVNVIGGHAGQTILPLLSQVPNTKFTEDEIEKLTHRIQFGGDEVVKAKDGAGSATLSMAHAANYFASRLLHAMHPDNEEEIIECAFVENKLTAAPFFSTPVKLGPNGVEKVLPFGKLSTFEQQSFDKMITELVAQEKKGIDFINK